MITFTCTRNHSTGIATSRMGGGGAGYSIKTYWDMQGVMYMEYTVSVGWLDNSNSFSVRSGLGRDICVI